MTERPQSEVKGIWFVAALDYARDAHVDAGMRQLLESSQHKYRDIYRNPVGSVWYPEEALQDLLAMIYDGVAQQHDSSFERIMEGCTEKGVNRIFQMLLRMSSPAFVLRHVPTMWRQVRRGAGHVVVEKHDGHSLIHYSEFPWFSDKRYRLLTTASLRAIVRCCAKEAPRVEVLDCTSDTLSVRLAYRASADLPAGTTQAVIAARSRLPAKAAASQALTRPSLPPAKASAESTPPGARSTANEGGTADARSINAPAPAAGSRRNIYDSAAPSSPTGTPPRPSPPNKS